MTKKEMRIAKQMLHKMIVDYIVGWEPDDDEMTEMWSYVEELARLEKSA